MTSRRHLSALEEATAISLDTLPPGEAARLLVRLAGRAADAEQLLRQALEIFQRTGAAEAADVSAELRALTGARASGS